MADVESKSIPHELPSSHWLKATGQCVLERYLSATMIYRKLKLLKKSKTKAPIWDFNGILPKNVFYSCRVETSSF